MPRIPFVRVAAVALIALSGCVAETAESGQADGQLAEVLDSTIVSTPSSTTRPSSTPVETTGPEPPQTTQSVAFTDGELEAFAVAIGANMVVAKPDPGHVLVWHEDHVVTLTSFDAEMVWADGRFVYQSFGEGRGNWAKASTVDGEVVCEVEGWLHHVTRRTDGSYVAAVEPVAFDDEPLPPGAGNPLFAEDCATGDRQPIDPVWFSGDEVGGLMIERVGGRVFELTYDAEGNADIRNEFGVLLNDADYSGYAAFDPSGSIVAYGDMAAGAGPHYSSVVIGRDTTTGEKLWAVDFGLPFVALDFIGKRVVVQLPASADSLFSGNPVPAVAVVLDGSTGEELARIETGFELRHLS